MALVTLGCARNEVDSEELAGRLEADGFRLVDDPDGRRHRRGQHLRLRRGRQEGLRRHPARGRRPEGAPGTAPQAVVAVGCLAERYGKELAESLPEADAVLGFDDYPDIAARLRSIVAGETHQAHTPQDRRRLLPISPVDARRQRDLACPGTRIAAAADLAEIGAGAPATGPRAVRRRLDGGPMAPLKLASGCDRRCSFCAIPSFRGSFVSRRPSDVLGEARWLADAGRQRAVPGQRELHVLRQGPRRPPAARDAAARAGRGRRHRAGAGLLPAARRDPPGPDRGDRHDARAWCRYFDLSFQHASADGAAPDAPLRRPGQLPRPARAGPRAGPAGRRPLQRHRRLPRRDRGRPADPVRLPRGGPDGRHGRLRLLRRGRHRGRDRTTASSTRTRSAPAPSTSPPWSRSSPPSAPRSASASRSGAGRVRRRRRSREGRGGPPGTGGRRHDDC